MTQVLEIIQPDDWHLHLRDGAQLVNTVAASANVFARAIVMPNLVPPITDSAAAEQYRQRILAVVPAGNGFQPLMTLYLTDNTTPEVIAGAKQSGIVAGCKLYPAGATTNSDAGVTDLQKLTPALEAMADHGLPLLVHGEVVDSEVDIFDREKVFIDRILAPLAERFTSLKIVLEHITTENAVRFVEQSSAQIAATITAHHLLLNRNNLLVGGIRPHYYCLPVLKRAHHQRALGEAVASGSAKFFLGTDSAPHARDNKESACGCAGCFTAPYAMQLYAEAFSELGALDKLEAFSSLNGPAFYGLPVNKGKIRLVKGTETIPKSQPFAASEIIPFAAGETLQWQAHLI